MADYQLALVAAIDDEMKGVVSKMDVDSRVHVRPSLFTKGLYRGKSIVAVRSGIGDGAMSKAMDYLFGNVGLKFCLHIGYCGGCDPRVASGDLIIVDSLVKDGESGVYRPKEELVERAVSICKEKKIRAVKGCMVTVPDSVHSPHDKAYVGAKNAAIGLDMESFAFAKACEERKVDYLVVRSVVDAVDFELPKFGKTMDECGSVNGAALVGDMMLHPKKIMQIPKVAYLAMQARQSLTTFFDAWTEAL